MPESFALPNGFSEILRRNPARLFWTCVAVHCVLWTLIPTLVQPNALPDVIEGYAWGHEWPLGTHKHPPLAAWILEALAVITGRAPWAQFFASQAAVAAAFWAVWQTGRRIVDETGAFVGALLLVGIGFYNILIPEFNPNVLQLPLWALIGWSYHRAVKENRFTDWLQFGFWSAAGIYAKYSTLVLLAVLGLLTIVHPESRERVRGRGLWIAVLTATLLLIPHIIWIAGHEFAPLIYTDGRFEPASSLGGYLAAPALLIAQVGAVCIPVILIYLVAFRRAARPSRTAMLSFDGMFLSFMTFGPLALTALIALISGASMPAMWATPFLNFLGLWEVFYLRPSLDTAPLRRFALLASGVFVLGLVGFAAKDLFEPYVTHKTSRIYFPGRALAERVTEEWHKRYNTPLRYVVGDFWPAGNVGYYSPDRPHVMIVSDYNLRPWITPEVLREEGNEVRHDGGVMVWCYGNCPTPDPMKILPFLQNFSQAVEQPPLTLPQQTGARLPPNMVGWAILPPQGK